MGLRVGGLISGLDTNSLIDSLIAVERLPLDRAQARRDELASEQGLFRELRSLVLNLRTAARELDNAGAEEEVLRYRATSSNDALVSVTADTDAVVGNTQLTVGALAQSALEVSTRFATDTEIVLAEGETIVLQQGTNDPFGITAGAGGLSLIDLRSAINTDAGNDGDVQASVINDGSGFRLLLAGTQTGLAEDLTLTVPSNPSFFDPDLSRDASDAQLTLFGGLSVTSPTNTVTGVIPGVTIELSGASADGDPPIEVGVEPDTEAVAEQLQGFANAYNAVLDFIDTQADVDVATNTAGPLSGDSTLRGIAEQLQLRLIDQYDFGAENPFTSLSDIGLSLNDSGRLELDSEQLGTVLAQNPDDLRQLFSGTLGEGDDAVRGVALVLIEVLDPILDENPLVGTLEGRDSGFDRQIRSLDDQIFNLEARLERREELLVQQFTQLETLLAQLQQQESSLASLVSNNGRG